MQVNSKRLLLLGLGGCGTNAVSFSAVKWDPTARPDLDMVGANTDWPHLKRTIDESKSEIKRWLDARGTLKNRPKGRLFPFKLGLSGRGAGGIPKAGRVAMKQSLPKLEELLFRKGKKLPDIVIVVGGLGGGTSTGAIPVVLRSLKKKKITTLTIVTSPFKSEGSDREEITKKALQELYKIGPTINIQNEKLPTKDREVDDPKKVFETINDACLVPILETLQQSIQVVGLLNQDNEDWRTCLSFGNYPYFSRADFSGDVDEVVEKLLAGNIFQDWNILKKAKAFRILFGGGTWRWIDTEKIIDKITSLSREKTINMKPGYLDEKPSEDKPLWVSVFAVAESPFEETPEPTPMSEAEVSSIARAQVETIEVNINHHGNGNGNGNGHTPVRTERIEVVNFAGQKQSMMVNPELAEQWKKIRHPDTLLSERVNTAKAVWDVVGFEPFVSPEVTTEMQRFRTKRAN
jgi:cell division GTPase FtsZ